ncbi:hypothetical protein ACP4OV_023771 [Aristida adscensionis]
MEAAPPPQRWAATYTKHLKQKRKAYHDGALLFHPGSGHLVLLDDAGDALDSRPLRAGEEVSAGCSLSFQAYLVDVGEHEADPASHRSTAASGASHRGGARGRPSGAGRASLRAPRPFVNPPKSRGGEGGCGGEAVGSCGGEGVDSRFQEWTALYTAQLTQKAKRYHDGIVRLVPVGPHTKQIVLLDEEGQVLGSRHLKSGESLESGKKCHFPNYLIEICEARKHGVDHNSSEEAMVHTTTRNGENTSRKMGTSAMSKSQKFISPQKSHDLEEITSKVTASSHKPETGKVEVVIAGSSGNLIEKDLDFKEWNALYTAQLTQKAKKYHDGIVRLMKVGSHARQIMLLDESGEMLGSRYLKSVESIENGMKCQMPNYLIEVCELRSEMCEPNKSLKEALNQMGQKGGENTSDNSEKSKSPKFVSPLKFQDIRKSNWGRTESSRRPQNFHDSDVNRRADHGKTTSGIMDDLPRFTDIQRDTSANFIWSEIGKSGSSRVGDPQQFNDLQHGKSGCPNSFTRREVGKSTFGDTDDTLRTASQILSIIKPPSEFKISQRAAAGQAHSLPPSGSSIPFDAICRKSTLVDGTNRTSNSSGNSGLSHFATQHRTSVQSCLKLETLQPKNSVRTHHWNEPTRISQPTSDHQTIMKSAAFVDKDLATIDILAADMSNVEERKLDSSNHSTGSSSDVVPVMNVTTNSDLQDFESGIVDELSSMSSTVDGKCDGPSSKPTYTLTCKDPKIQQVIDDCPSFDLGF